jgi:tRNA-specific 2-thiouridylase
MKRKNSNPDVLCNREIKFDVFMKIALSLGADYVATGHYCKKRKLRCMAKVYQLLAGADNNKDQSYFLVNYHKNNWLNHYFLLGIDQTRSA